MPIKPKTFRVDEGDTVHLSKWPTAVDPIYASKDDYQQRLAVDVERLSDLQQVLYASASHSVLLILQAMDAAGKDGVIRHVMSGVNPQGCQVVSFKEPSATERAHDFLWRTTRELPERGRIGIFNRSYYEEVLIARVHPQSLRAQVGHPGISDKPGKAFWENRFTSISALEAHLDRCDTRIVKIFLHISKDEQRRRFLARIDDPSKNWKFSQSDIDERGYWDDYMRAYEACLTETSTRAAPWYVVPADDKQIARLIVSAILLETLEKLDLAYPVTTDARRQELLAIRERLVG